MASGNIFHRTAPEGFEWAEGEGGNIELLRRLTAQKQSVRYCAAAIGTSCAAIVSKRQALNIRVGHRLGEARVVAAKQNAGKQPPQNYEKLAIKPFALPPTAATVGLFGLKRLSCRWPYDDAANECTVFCGALTKEGSSFCADHRKMVYVPTRKPVDDNFKTRPAWRERHA